MSGSLITISFGELHHGWWDVEIEVKDDWSFSDSISWTPNDGIRDFLGAMKVMLASRGAVGRCEWSNEPGFFAVFLENRDPELHFFMRFVPEYFREPTEKDKIWCECTCNLAEFAHSFQRAFQKLITRYEVQEYERCWGHAFPRSEWQQLLPLLIAAQ